VSRAHASTGGEPSRGGPDSPGDEASRAYGRGMDDETTAAPARDATALAIGAAGVTVLLWASAFVGIRAAGEHVSPGPLTLGRLLIGGAVLGVFVGLRRATLPPRADVPRLLVCGLLWFGAYNVLLNAAEQRVDAGTAAMLTNVGPILIAVLAGLLLREGFPRALLAGCAIAFAGAVVIGLATSERSGDAGWGAALAISAAAAYAGGVVAQKPILDRTSGLQVTFLACVIGAVACAPFAPALGDELADAPPAALAWTIYLGVFPTAVGFTTWAYALKRTSAGRMGATIYLVPPLTVILGWAMLDEAPPPLALLGGALCLAGVAVSRGARAGRRSPPRR
jgi:drug/metabolite transporter (DMT)-like permease